MSYFFVFMFVFLMSYVTISSLSGKSEKILIITCTHFELAALCTNQTVFLFSDRFSYLTELNVKYIVDCYVG